MTRELLTAILAALVSVSAVWTVCGHRFRRTAAITAATACVGLIAAGANPVFVANLASSGYAAVVLSALFVESAPLRPKVFVLTAASVGYHFSYYWPLVDPDVVAHWSNTMRPVGALMWVGLVYLGASILMQKDRESCSPI